MDGQSTSVAEEEELLQHDTSLDSDVECDSELLPRGRSKPGKPIKLRALGRVAGTELYGYIQDTVFTSKNGSQTHLNDGDGVEETENGGARKQQDARAEGAEGLQSTAESGELKEDTDNVADGLISFPVSPEYTDERDDAIHDLLPGELQIVDQPGEEELFIIDNRDEFSISCARVQATDQFNYIHNVLYSPVIRNPEEHRNIAQGNEAADLDNDSDSSRPKSEEISYRIQDIGLKGNLMTLCSRRIDESEHTQYIHDTIFAPEGRINHPLEQSERKEIKHVPIEKTVVKPLGSSEKGRWDLDFVDQNEEIEGGNTAGIEGSPSYLENADTGSYRNGTFKTYNTTPREYDEETKWIRNHIKRRECSDFVPVATDKQNVSSELMMCQCGHAYQDHDPSIKRGSQYNFQGKWDPKLHSRQKMTNAFGELEFVGYGGNVGKYIRVDIDSKMSDMLELMMTTWGLEKPNLLISVTGGAKNFQMNKRLKETFRRGLMKTALTTGAWIITGGTHAGVMKHVGEAVKDFGVASASQGGVISIGIAPWGCIQNREHLIEPNCQGMWPAQYRIEKEQKMKESFLDPNHTHFVLVDNGTAHKFGVEIPFRASLEKEVSKIRTDTGENAVSVPIVLLVLEGGPGTLETVFQSIKNNTPSVIVKGSGRAADILAYAYLNAKEEEIEAQDQEGRNQKKTRRYMEDSLLLEVQAMVQKEFGMSNYGIHMDRIRQCLDKCELMSVFELDSKVGSKEIDVTMLQALLKANKDQVMDQLRLALAWNRIDVAKSDIFTDDKQWPTGSLDDIMLSAVLLNRKDFVELFLDHGVSLREFLTIKRLLLLYKQIPPNCLLRTLLMKIKNKEDSLRNNFSLFDVAMLIQELMGDYYSSHYAGPTYAHLDVDGILEGRTLRLAKEGGMAGLSKIAQFAVNMGGADVETNSGRRSNQGQQKHDFENPTQELFIWCTLMIRQDMAKLFWAEGKDAIAAALVGNALLRALKKKTEDTELAISIQQNIDEWSELAIGVLNDCHSTDEHKAQDLLVRELPYWGETTCMLIAVKADNKDFISQTACQLLLNRIWMGKMTQDNHLMRLFTCMFFPPLALVLIRFSFEAEMTEVGAQASVTEKKEEESKPAMTRKTTFVSMKSSSHLPLHGSRTTLQAVDEDNKEEMKPTKPPAWIAAKNKLYCFLTAPVIIFMYNVLSYLVFLALFSYVLIFDFQPKVSSYEIILMIWVFTIFTEEIRQVASTTSSTLSTKLQSYITDTWNVVDIITILLFIIGVVLRSLPDEDTFEAARVFLALNFVSFFLRLLHIFSVHKELGPKLVMIGRMVQDLMYFVVILMVFVVSYAIASHSILFPNAPLTWTTAQDVIYRAYWNIYGELFLDEIQGENSCTYDEALWMNATLPRCPSDVGKVVVPILMGVYMLLANVLLLNLLIAMFSYTFQMVQDNTDKHWFYQRYSLIYEYYTRPVLCPPFILLAHLYLLFKFILEKCCCRGKLDSDEDDFRRKFKNERELVQWENVIADAFHHKTELESTESSDYKISTTYTRVESLINRLDELQEQQNQQMALVSASSSSSASTGQATTVTADTVLSAMPTQVNDRLFLLEKKIESTQASLDWIVKALQDSPLLSQKALPQAPDSNEYEEKMKKDAQTKAAKEKQLVQEMVESVARCHFRSRSSPYPNTSVMRYPVPDAQVPWKEELADYSPPVFTSEEVLTNTSSGDQDLMTMSVEERSVAIRSFNLVDKQFNCNRVSLVDTYQVIEGLPINPAGRTGLRGRGGLWRWGPNHAGDPVVTRWKMVDGQVERKGGKPVFEFVAVMRADNHMWSLPGAIMPAGSKPMDHLKADFTEEALGNLEGTSDQKTLKKKLQKLWKKGVPIYEGYADDPRNTDNAWLETTVINYHDERGKILQHFNLRAGDSVELATWLTASDNVTLHGAHTYFLQLTAERLNAYF